MKNTKLQHQIIEEVDRFLHSRKSLMLSTLDKEGLPCSSYAPFTIYQQHLFIFISELALHTQHLIDHPQASILLIEDEDNCDDVFARIRLIYQIKADAISRETELWPQVIEEMTTRLGDRVTLLSQLSDFILFQLTPLFGRYVKGFGKAYELTGDSLMLESVEHINKR